MAETLTATLHTSMGDININLFPDQAPKTVRNFTGLAEGTQEWTDPQARTKTTRPLYDGTVFHRIIPGFMIQGGDPLGTCTGGPGFRFALGVVDEHVVAAAGQPEGGGRQHVG